MVVTYGKIRKSVVEIERLPLALGVHLLKRIIGRQPRKRAVRPRRIAMPDINQDIPHGLTSININNPDLQTQRNTRLILSNILPESLAARVEVRPVTCLGSENAGPVPDEVVFGGLGVDGVVCFAGAGVDGEGAAAEGVGALHLIDLWAAFLGEVLVGLDGCWVGGWCVGFFVSLVYLGVFGVSCTRNKSAQAEQRQEDGFGDHGCCQCSKNYPDPLPMFTWHNPIYARLHYIGINGHFLPAAQFRPSMIQHYKSVKWIRYSHLPTSI